MDILTLTNEYPPHVYGGAGVHVDHLVRALRGCGDGRNRLQVLCFGRQRERRPDLAVTGVDSLGDPAVVAPRHPGVLDPLYRNVFMAGAVESADVVHCHTWYTHLAGCLIKQILQCPLVVTTHSLEPRRPWKAEQLGGGHRAAAWVEQTALLNADAVIAVSEAMRADTLRLFDVAPEKVTVIHNGIDARRYVRRPDAAVAEAFGIDPDVPMVLFVGRVTRQKGIVHLLRALHHVKTDFQMVLCAGAADTRALAAEVAREVAAVRGRTNIPVTWIDEMVPVRRLVALYSQADLFVCPSVYEPFGIINLEAMACGTPVVASAVGGVPEVVVHGETGLLVPFEPAGPSDAEPKHPDAFARGLAEAIDGMMRSPEKRAAMGAAARLRVEARFGWDRIARRTMALYERLVRP